MRRPGPVLCAALAVALLAPLPPAAIAAGKPFSPPHVISLPVPVSGNRLKPTPLQWRNSISCIWYLGFEGIGRRWRRLWARLAQSLISVSPLPTPIRCVPNAFAFSLMVQPRILVQYCRFRTSFLGEANANSRHFRCEMESLSPGTIPEHDWYEAHFSPAFFL